MGKSICSKMCFSRSSKKKIILLLLGLQNAGKTTLAKGLAGELENGVVPTLGFSSVTLKYKKFTVILYDLGGGPGIRAIWENYFADAHGIIFVLDSGDIEKVNECRDILKRLLSNEKLSGKPLLVFGNKQDVESTLDEIHIVEILNLEYLVNQHKCPTLVETCSAISLEKSHLKEEDPVIRNSFKWLLSIIERDFETLNRRVEQDMCLQKEMQDAKFNEILQRMQETNLKKSKSDCSEADCSPPIDQVSVISHMDPFQPIYKLVNGDAENSENTAQLDNLSRSSGKALSGSSSPVKRLQRQANVEDSDKNGPKRRKPLSCLCTHSTNVSEINKSPNCNWWSYPSRFCLWRKNRTAPLNVEMKEEDDGKKQLAGRVIEGESTHESLLFTPPLFTITSQQENMLEMEEFSGVRHPNRPVPFQVMKG